ncbi:MAG: hypothetical protein ACKVU4_06575 [Phycisphaerales bacterium]
MSVECNSTACDSRNATPPAPAIAPGIEAIDAMRAAERAAARGMDPRVTALVPSFDAPFFQAGLCGYSDAAMRIVARRHGCPFCVTEALLDRTLLAGGRGFAKADLGEIEDNVPGGDEDHPLAGQIMGSDPREMAAAALKMVEQGSRPPTDYRRLAYVVNGRVPATESSKLKAQLGAGTSPTRMAAARPRTARSASTCACPAAIRSAGTTRWKIWLTTRALPPLRLGAHPPRRVSPSLRLSLSRPSMSISPAR